MKKRIVQIILILCGIGLISFIGYHVYLQYAKDIDILLNPKASQALLQKTVRSHGVITAALLILLTTVMCVVPGIPTSIVGVLVGLVMVQFLEVSSILVGMPWETYSLFFYYIT